MENGVSGGSGNTAQLLVVKEDVEDLDCATIRLVVQVEQTVLGSIYKRKNVLQVSNVLSTVNGTSGASGRNAQ